MVKQRNRRPRATFQQKLGAPRRAGSAGPALAPTRTRLCAPPRDVNGSSRRSPPAADPQTRPEASPAADPRTKPEASQQVAGGRSAAKTTGTAPPNTPDPEGVPHSPAHTRPPTRRTRVAGTPAPPRATAAMRTHPDARNARPQPSRRRHPLPVPRRGATVTSSRGCRRGPPDRNKPTDPNDKTLRPRQGATARVHAPKRRSHARTSCNRANRTPCANRPHAAKRTLLSPIRVGPSFRRLQPSGESGEP